MFPTASYGESQCKELLFLYSLSWTLPQAAGNTLAVHLAEKWPDAFSSDCLTHTSNLRAHKCYIGIMTLKLYRRACHSQLSRGDQHQLKARQSFSLFRIMLRNQRFVALCGDPDVNVRGTAEIGFWHI